MEARLKNYRQSPRKVRLLARMIKGLSVSAAVDQLNLMAKKSAPDLRRLIASAAANARNNFNITTDQELIIKDLRVDKGMTLRRMRPAARGRGTIIRRRRSNVAVYLKTDQPAGSPPVVKTAPPADKK